MIRVQYQLREPLQLYWSEYARLCSNSFKNNKTETLKALNTFISVFHMTCSTWASKGFAAHNPSIFHLVVAPFGARKEKQTHSLDWLQKSWGCYQQPCSVSLCRASRKRILKLSRQGNIRAIGQVRVGLRTVPRTCSSARANQPWTKWSFNPLSTCFVSLSHRCSQMIAS